MYSFIRPRNRLYTSAAAVPTPASTIIAKLAAATAALNLGALSESDYYSITNDIMEGVRGLSPKAKIDIANKAEAVGALTPLGLLFVERPLRNPAKQLEKAIKKVKKARKKVSDSKNELAILERKISTGRAGFGLFEGTPADQLKIFQSFLEKDLEHLAVAEEEEQVIRKGIIDELRGIFNKSELTEILSSFAGVPVLS